MQTLGSTDGLDLHQAVPIAHQRKSAYTSAYMTLTKNKGPSFFRS